MLSDSSRPVPVSRAVVLSADRSREAVFGLRERSSRFPLSCGRQGGSFAAAFQNSYRCTMTL